LREAAEGEKALLGRAWPFREELTDPETLGYGWSRQESDEGGPPEEWYRGSRLVIHQLMRLAFEEGESYLVEVLEHERESTAAQLAYALADAERKGHGYQENGAGISFGVSRPLCCCPDGNLRLRG
jgi:hypothetical protein